ncbi:MAG: VWA domain-containing protein, partial [Chthoniobacterales bacterium]
SFWSDNRWASIGLAAVLAVCAVIAAVVFSGGPTKPVITTGSYIPTQPATTEVQLEVDSKAAQPAGTPVLAMNEPAPPEFVEEQPAIAAALPSIERKISSGSGSFAATTVATRSKPLPATQPAQEESFSAADYGHFDDNPFLPAETNPLSTFSIDVDTASYANVRRMINAGTKPPKDAVRVEEMLNYFSYDYPQPKPNEPFSINLEVAGCPWTPEHRLVRIGLKGRETAADQRDASNLVFLLDVSGSMDPANRLPLVKQAMRLLVDRLTENDRVAIVVYAGRSGVVLPSTTGDRKEEILRALEELQAGGSTNGASGINLAYQLAAEHFIKGGVNRVILATDGDFNVGVTSPGELVRLAEEKAKGGVFLTVLGVGDDNLKDATMQKLADNANGNYAYLDSLDEARKVLVQQMNATLVTIAKDVKVQVEFNPLHVASYRLIGYEKRLLRNEDFNNDKIDAGEIGAGHTVTALYEVVPRGSEKDPLASAPPVDPLKYATPDPRAVASSYPSPDLLTVKLRYKKPDGDKSELIEQSLVDSGTTFAKASPDFRFAAAVAEFGLILRDSEHKGNASLSAVLENAAAAKGEDAHGYRAGFIELARKARSMAF